MSKVGIVTVLYNSRTVLEEYFYSLDKQTFKDFTLYVIDNNSPDDSLSVALELTRKVNFKCVVFPEKDNWGVAKGNNIGIMAALKDGCKYILLSNNDVVLNYSNTLEVLVNKMDGTDIDILCPKIFYYDNPSIIWAAGGTFIKNGIATLHYGMNKEDCDSYNQECEIEYTPTCFVIIRREVFQIIGLMDEWYFVYYDDTDFMYRGNRARLKINYTPETSLLHKESISTGSGSPLQAYFFERNQLYFVKKHRSKAIYLFLIFQRISAFLLKHIWIYEKKIWEAELKGLIDGIKSRVKK